MKLIPQNEVDEAADKFDHNVKLGDLLTTKIFKAGVEFAESKFHENIKDIIIENQGLKLYKDNEPKRFEELAIEFLNWYKFIDYEKDYLGCTTEELFKLFLKERNKKE